MYVFACVRVCVCVWVHECMSVCTCASVCLCVCSCKCGHVCVCAYRCMYILVCVCVLTCVCTRVCVYMCVCTRVCECVFVLPATRWDMPSHSSFCGVTDTLNSPAPLFTSTTTWKTQSHNPTVQLCRLTCRSGLCCGFWDSTWDL